MDAFGKGAGGAGGARGAKVVMERTSALGSERIRNLRAALVVLLKKRLV
jgi:hypothetical protein